MKNGFYDKCLKLLGWKLENKVEIPSKCILCIAPHTSNWDLPLGLLAYKSLRSKPHFLIKKSWFFFPMNLILKTLGGIPVDRSKKTSMTEQITEYFNSNETFYLAITPEGTRKANSNWKHGFYYISIAAKVPIIIISFDYKIKTIVIHKAFSPTGNVEHDMHEIKSYYKNVQAKHPENFKI